MFVVGCNTTGKAGGNPDNATQNNAEDDCETSRLFT
jgi:hypothetical protein